MEHPFNCALVTGASTGIGKALCELLADKKINLIIVARSAEKLESLAQQLRSKIEVDIVVADLSDHSQRGKVQEKIHEKAPDLVINNAGWGYYGEALTFETEQSMNLLEVNVAALLEITLESARTMISSHKKGVIMNVSSAAAFEIFPCFSIYAASKAFVNSFSESFNEELSSYGVSVLVCCPGMVDTEFRHRASEGEAGSPDSNSMNVIFAANEIWNQIMSRKPLRTFDWRYRFATFFTKYILPKKIVAYLVRKNVEARHSKKPFIPIKRRIE